MTQQKDSFLQKYETNSAQPSGETKWYRPVSLLFCNKKVDNLVCGNKAVAIEHDTHSGYTGVNRCEKHRPLDKPIRRKDI